MRNIVFLLLFISNLLHARDLGKEYESARIKLANKTLQVYVADTNSKRALGLMHIEKMGKDEGMLFVFEREEQLSFWMRNTLIPLSIGYFDKQGNLIDIQEMSVPSTVMDPRPPSYPSKRPAIFALEMNQHWFKKNKILEGARLTLVAPSKSALLNSKLKSH